MDGRGEPLAGDSRRRRLATTRAWIVVSVAYGGIRALAVRRWLAPYGVNPAVFAAVELGSSAGYGWASARVVLDVVDRDIRALRVSGPLALVAYAAPDAYVFATVGHIPVSLLATVVSIVTVSASVAVLALARGVRAAGSRARK